MAGAKKTALDDDEKTVEEELADLQRKFRVLENDKRAYSEDSQAHVRKQRAAIEKLARDNRSMKAEMSEWRSAGGAASVLAKQQSQRLQIASDDRETVQRRLEQDLRNKARLEDRMEALSLNLKEVREELAVRGGVRAATDNADAVAKQVRVLESRLDLSLQKFNKCVSHNAELREQIDALRRERVVFDSIYRKLELELQAKKREMATIIEQANAAYEARDSAQAQMASLKAQADREHAEFEREWKELGRLVQNDRKMKLFLAQKERQRATEEEKKKESDRADDEERVKKKVTRSAWSIAKDKSAVDLSQERISAYEEAFTRIQAATGIADIDELVSSFLNAEDTTFSLFGYANELTAGMELLEDEISNMKGELERLKGLDGGDDAEKQAALREAEEKFSKADKLAEQHELRYQQAMKTLTATRAGVQSVFNRLGCAPPDGSQQGEAVSEANILAFLGKIEEQVDTLLLLHRSMDDAPDEEHQLQPKGSALTQLQMKLPSTVEDYSDEDASDEEDDTRPYTREELRAKSLRGLQKKQERPRRGRRG